jgi:hypothetical protein
MLGELLVSACFLKVRAVHLFSFYSVLPFDNFFCFSVTGRERKKERGKQGNKGRNHMCLSADCHLKDCG